MDWEEDFVTSANDSAFAPRFNIMYTGSRQTPFSFDSRERDFLKILVTGASSKLGRWWLPRLSQRPEVGVVYALTRKISINSNEIAGSHHEKIKWIEGDLAKTESVLSLPEVDRVLHLAALTHSTNEESYFFQNTKTTETLSREMRKRGVKSFWFVSSQAAGVDSGAYGFSKWEAEKILIDQSWPELLIFRPAEVVGMGSSEGLDRFVSLAKEKKLHPLLLSWRGVVYSPLRGGDLISEMERFWSSLDSLKDSMTSKSKSIVPVIMIHGPAISSLKLAQVFWKKWRALPLPVPLFALDLLIKIFSFLGKPLASPDQVRRLTGKRGQRPHPRAEMIDREVRSELVIEKESEGFPWELLP